MVANASVVCVYAILLLLLLSDFRSGAVDEFTRHGHTMFLFRTESTTPIVFFFPRVLHYYAADDENERRLFPIRPPTLTEIPVTLLNKSFIRSKKKRKMCKNNKTNLAVSFPEL